MGLNDNLDEQTDAARDSVLIRAAALDRANAIIKDKMATGAIPAAPAASNTLRAFIAPVEKNTRYLIASGKINHIVDPNSPTGKRDTFRDDEVWVEFHDGIVVFDETTDTKQIEWCEGHPAICRDIQDPLTEAWAFMKEAQQNLSNREAVLPQSLDIDASLMGRSGGVPHSSVTRAREHLQLAENA